MSRISLAFRSFFAILFHGALPDALLTSLGLAHRAGSKPVPAPAAHSPSDGALQMLAILQRDARLIDFLMEDISSYSDDQVGAAVRSLHDQCRDSLQRYVQLAPVIDGVEGTHTKLASADPASVKLLGNVPPQPPPGGTLRHRGWRCAKIDLPAPGARHNFSIVAPAEVEIE
ncbi:MAG: DUF2760 domain-containing protein [Acidobacteria bacterium]|nr:DUF2760 domain-containing protein [Acidobacteriota bacterium]MBI3471407.1 DUF2760 domain-containing protein [Candidatus Solibacter usitatus]